MQRLFFLALVALSINGIADTVRATNARALATGQESRSGFPSLNIEAGCQDVAKNDLNKTTDYPGCLSDERKAREQLQKEWASYPADMQSQCMHLVTPPALPSYMSLQECLKMSRDARNLTKSDGATDIGKTMQSPSHE
jgi:hypothetical protein